ncbi:hypothetical protein HYPSUDRAFT_200090 [Hypholoma sublateritium FD-334 SS-4]|uniref:Uncharacterized protein n=1 Tax=Hypholoma sublateritium (strain FD-334 SS-4) TaxID=945553 RepID=A0A0D2MMQ7_HYPSF|nr:hypothetical protein HYPSUDRAFT_200090 [Hypholoma sublateritium FD-334 SS-4]
MIDFPCFNSHSASNTSWAENGLRDQAPEREGRVSVFSAEEYAPHAHLTPRINPDAAYEHRRPIAWVIHISNPRRQGQVADRANAVSRSALQRGKEALEALGREISIHAWHASMLMYCDRVDEARRRAPTDALHLVHSHPVRSAAQRAAVTYGVELDVPAATILSTFGLRAQSYWWSNMSLLGIFFVTFTAVSYTTPHY